jgi:hypothetical protein
MAIIGALDKTKHFDEFNSPLASAQGVLTPDQRKALAIANLQPTIASTLVGTIPAVSTIAREEFFDGIQRLSKFTMTNFSLGNSGDNASLAIGALFYTLPAGDILVEGVSIAGGLTAALSNTAQTPEVGVGSVIGTGAVATLSTTLEDYVDGGAAGIIGGNNTAPDVAGGLFRKGTLATSIQGVVVLATGGKARTMHLNAAVAWADVTAAAAVLFNGVITVRWRKIN